MVMRVDTVNDDGVVTELRKIEDDRDEDKDMEQDGEAQREDGLK